MSLNNNEIYELRQNYKIIDVDYLDHDIINLKMMNDDKKEVVNKMVNYYLNQDEKFIYKITDYLCNDKEKICICNIQADTLRKSYGDNYKQQNKYISWYKDD